MNWLVWLDRTGNLLLLGNPNETISRRTARASAAGVKWANIACRALSMLLGHDHCSQSLRPGSCATEIWAWSDNFTQPVLTPNRVDWTAAELAEIDRALRKIWAVDDRKPAEFRMGDTPPWPE